MSIDIQRRMAFAKAFKQYPDLLTAFVDGNVWLESPKDTKVPPAQLKLNKGQKDFAAQVLMAQFMTRLIKTRARGDGGSPEMGWFAFECAARYASYKQSKFKDLELNAEAKYRNAMAQIEQNIATAIFGVLAEEALDGSRDKWAEIGFWHDVFLAFCENQRRHHPLWIEPIQYVVMDYMQEFRAALNAPPVKADTVN